MSLLKGTPIEKYGEIYVKRDDLCCEDSPIPLPSLAKLRGAERFLIKLKEQGIKTVGVFDTRVSKAGWGVTGLCKSLGLKCVSYYPKLKDREEQVQQYMSRMLGAKMVGLKGGRTAVLYSQATKHLTQFENSFMLPLGLVMIETAVAVSEISSEIPKFGTIVLSTGTGTILSGILCGLKEENTPNKVIGISAGMNLEKQKKRILGILTKLKRESMFDIVELVMADKGYYEPEFFHTPFPSHPYYDKKAYKWLTENIEKLDKPILFWNIGS